MNKKLILILATVFVAVITCSVLVMAATEVPGEPMALTVEGQTKPLKVKFDHAKHKDFQCTDCHHVYKPDDKGAYPKDKRGAYKELPENHFQQGQEVQLCSQCHKLEGDKKTAKSMKTDADKIRSMEDAFHDNCLACHREINKAKKLKGADALPFKCTDCHEK